MVRLFVSGLIVIVATSLAAPRPATAQPSIQVYIDGRPVSFDVPPVVIQGRVLVPLRGVFERMGATVDYDARTQHIVAIRGGQAVALTVGSRQTQVNTVPTLLDVPAFTVAGRTMVPLRFVSQALGADVQWVDASRLILINSGGTATIPVTQPSQPGPPPPAQPQMQSVSGRLVTVATGGSPHIVVQSGGETYSIAVTPTTAIYRYDAETRAGGAVSLSALQPGDSVTATVNGLYQATQISSLYHAPAAPPPAPAPAKPLAIRIVEGQIAGATFSARMVTLANGQNLTVLRDVYVARNGGATDFGAVAAGRYGRFWVIEGTNQAVAVDLTEPMALRIVEERIADANYSARTVKLASGQTFSVLRDVHITRNGRPTDFGAVAAGRLGRFWVIAGTNQAVAVDLADATAGPAVLSATRIVRGSIVDANFQTRTARLAGGQTLSIAKDAYIARNGGRSDFGAVAAGRYGRFWVIEGSSQAFLVDLTEPIVLGIVEGKIVDADFQTRTARLAGGQTLSVTKDAYIARNGGRSDFGAVAAGRYGRFWVIEGSGQAVVVDLREE